MKPRQRSLRRKTPVLFKYAFRLMVGLSLLITLGVSVVLTAAHMEENDAFCASCHSEPESTYYTRTQAATKVDLATAHHAKQVRCIDCHSGAGATGRIGAMQIGASDLFLFVTNQARQPAPLLTPIADANCLKCHSEIPQTQSFNRHFHAFLAKWQGLDKNAATCVSCHTGHTTDGSEAIVFLQQARTIAICQQCHTAVGAGG